MPELKTTMHQLLKNKLTRLVLASLIVCAGIPAYQPLHAQVILDLPGAAHGDAEPPLRPLFLQVDHEDAAEQVEAARLFDLLQGKLAFSEYTEAVEPAKQIVNLALLEYGPDAAELAEPWINLGQALELAGEKDQAGTAYLESIRLVTGQYGSLDARLVRPLAGLGRLAQASGNNEQAAELFEQARYLLRRSEGLYTLQQVPILESTANSLMVMEQPEAASRKQYIVYQLYTRTYGSNSPELIEPLMRLGSWSGLMYLSLSPGAQAKMVCMIDRRAVPDYSSSNQCVLPGQRDLYRMAISIIEESFGEDDPRLIGPLRAMANSYYLMSVRWVRRQETQSSAYSVSAPTTYYEAVNQEGGAREALERALQITRKQADYDPRSEAQLLVDLGDWHIAFRRNIPQGQQYYQQAWHLIANGEGGADEANLVFRDPKQLLVKGPSLSQSRSYTGGYSDAENPPRGKIVIQFDVGTDGSVLNETILEPAESDLQGEARRAAGALSKSYFRPRVVDGEALYTAAIIWRNPTAEAD
ncbi:MAG: tetratricopeptide repeat protein [Gammaproteobacteria bacterium]|nr:tetratricopeptide repeat protein [Gammaproteobacteria bacterium]